MFIFSRHTILWLISREPIGISLEQQEAFEKIELPPFEHIGRGIIIPYQTIPRVVSL